MTLLRASDTPPPHTTQRVSHAQQLLHRIHFFAGIFCAPFILIAALTGLVYSLSPTIENIAYRDVLTVENVPADPSEAALPTSELVDIAQEQHPSLSLSGVRFGEESETIRVLFTDSTLPESTLRAVFINPYTGEITGDSTQYGSSAALPFRHWVSQGHRMLWMGEPGRIYSELAASWLGVLAIGGFVLLWNRQKSPRKLRGMLRLGGKGRVKNYRRHAALGTVAGVGFVFLTLTGLTWSAYAGNNVTELREALNWTQPTIQTSVDAAPVAHHHEEASTSHADLNTIDQVAHTTGAELRAPFTITPPSEDGLAWTATENRQAYRLSNDSIAIDGRSGDVVSRLNFAEWPLAAQASSWLIQLHMGTLFGLPNQIALAGLALAVIAMIIFGYSMWWARRPRAGLPANPRRAQHTRRGWGTWALYLALIVYAMCAPLFGISLVVFLALSSGWRALRRRQLGRRQAQGFEAQI